MCNCGAYTGCLPTEAKQFLNFLNCYCKKNKLILIFDEMITGLRFNCSSVQNQVYLEPSISTFGKCFEVDYQSELLE